MGTFFLLNVLKPYDFENNANCVISQQVPLHYDLQLHPILEKNLFTGTVTIEIELTNPSSCFVLHSDDLRLSNVRVTSSAGQESEVEEVFFHKEHSYAVVKTREKMTVGLYRLYIEFEGTLKMNLQGLYKSSYVDPVSNERR